MNRWDSAFDVWTYCHPCKAHDLENTDGSKYADQMGYDDEYYKDDDDDQNNRRLGFESKPKGNAFECYDDGKCAYRSCILSVQSPCPQTSFFCSFILSPIHKCQPMHEVLCQDCDENCHFPRLVPGTAPGYIGPESPLGIHCSKYNIPQA
jgi:hypothetical protein